MKEKFIVSFISFSIAWTLAAMITGVLWVTYTLTRPMPPIVIKAPEPPSLVIQAIDGPPGYCLSEAITTVGMLAWVKCP